MTALTEQATAQQAAFVAAAAASPVRQVRAEFTRRAREWGNALALVADGGEDEYEIDLAGAIVPGDRVLAMVASPYSDDRDREACAVVRVLHRDGQSSIHVNPPSSGRDLYLNYAGPSSPVVVQR